MFGSAEAFLHEQLLPTLVRDVGDRSAKWCMEWCFHPEALWRLWKRPQLTCSMRANVNFAMVNELH